MSCRSTKSLEAHEDQRKTLGRRQLSGVAKHEVDQWLLVSDVVKP